MRGPGARDRYRRPSRRGQHERGSGRGGAIERHYHQLLTILDTYGFTTVDTGGYVRVIPDAVVREEPLPFVSGNEKRPDDEYVTTVFHVRSIPAGWFVPILRPLLPQQAHLASMPCANDLVLADRFANVRRIESIIKAMDTGEPIKPPSCSVPMPQPH